MSIADSNGGTGKNTNQTSVGVPDLSSPLFGKEKAAHVGATLRKGWQGDASAAIINARSNATEKV